MEFAGRPLPGLTTHQAKGLTTHQAKGGEWDIVGVRLRDAERAALAAGLSMTEGMHRKRYVACIRARYRTHRSAPATPSHSAKRETFERST
jgi:DNA helicase-2/ATP-dependent DNA helicase PcrA